MIIDGRPTVGAGGAIMGHIGGFAAGIISAIMLLVLGIDDGSQAHPVIAQFCKRTSFQHAVFETAGKLDLPSTGSAIVGQNPISSRIHPN